MAEDGPDVADSVDVLEENREWKAPQGRPTDSIIVKRKSRGMLFDQPDDAVDFFGEVRAEAFAGLLISITRTDEFGARGRMEANRHSAGL